MEGTSTTPGMEVEVVLEEDETLGTEKEEGFAYA
tara:strand:+ start:221 stop:322 length:102 start_codon:yes stop_codon:yes gene_type:complete